ncbi:MAG: protein-L-isoaspartate(D-aspartate) O-methyltransferase [Myxococcota bacterium]|nr:protein-L-isoaspartate(D-aspartate) O-methyltransferase [Myxococcota bacterium]
MERLEHQRRSSERRRMVATQIRARGVTDAGVLNAMETVPRHHFMPDATRHLAYGDHPVPIGHDQTISQPLIVAFMTEALHLKPEDTVLEIGTGSGYQTAVLAEIVKKVYSIEIVPPLGQQAARILTDKGYSNVQTRIGDGDVGWPEAAPFDAIMLTAAPPKIPQPLLDQLAVGGRLIAPVGRDAQTLVVVRRTSTGYTRNTVMAVRFVPMTGRAQAAD